MKNCNAWIKEGVNCEFKYEIEYVNDKKIWENMVNEVYENDWEYYEKKEFDNLGKAMSVFTYMFYNDRVYFCQMWQRVYIDGEMVREDYVEPDSTAFYTLSRMINRVLSDRYYAQHRQLDELLNTNSDYQEFVKKLNQEDLFYQFVEQKKNEKEKYF